MIDMRCRGCTGTCCTGVGSEPCTCPDEYEEEKEREREEEREEEED